MDAPRFRIWPPIALGVPFAAGWIVTATAGDPFAWPAVRHPIGWTLIGAFAAWNGWSLILMARHRTALLPGGATTTLLSSGPFRVSRNPLYVGLIALDIALALLAPSFWALASIPVGVLALWWGAVAPEERYLREKFGPAYEDYFRRVRRWL